jgi:putative two-component system response regulator
LAVADVYDALRSKRPYKAGFPHEESCRLILEGRGSQFDTEVIDAFVEMGERFERVYEELS